MKKHVSMLGSFLAAATLLVSCGGIGGNSDSEKKENTKREPKEWTIDLTEELSSVILAKNYPWVNGKQDFSAHDGYQATPKITKLFSSLPHEGDTIKYTWKVTAQNNLTNLSIRNLDNSAKASYWKELEKQGNESVFIRAEKLDAGVETTLTWETTLAADPIEDVAFVIRVGLNDSNGENVLGKAVSFEKEGTTKHVYYSNVCERMRYINVTLPKGYTKDKKYPVLYFLHGYWETQDSWIETDAEVQKLIDTGAAEDMIIVHPFIYCHKTRSNCVDFSNREDHIAYNTIVEEIPQAIMPWLKEHYSIKEGRENTAVIGFSMGGRESLACGILNQDLFGWVGAICPAPGLLDDQIPSADAVFKKETTPAYLMIMAGNNDTVVYDNPKTYNEHFKNKGFTVDFETVSSGHGNPAVTLGMKKFAQKIFK